MVEKTRTGHRVTAASALFVGLVLLCVGSAKLANHTQTDGGAVTVTNVSFRNKHDLSVRGKLFVPRRIPAGTKTPGAVFIPGYQSVRETGDGICIELARRGFAALTIDALGRGNSDIPIGLPGDPDYDETFGGQAAMDFLRSVDGVDQERLGIMGHSLGGQMAFKTAMMDPSLRAVVVIGTAYSEEATPSHPKNMLMAIGKYDEHRSRMTGTRDIESEWMKTPRSIAAFGRRDAVVGRTYGDFGLGTARKVIVPPVTHELETHDPVVIANAVDWMTLALGKPSGRDLHSSRQIWQVKEWSTLAMMIFGFAALIPLSFLLIRTPLFMEVRKKNRFKYHCSPKDFVKFGAVNVALMWLYLPSALILFGIHKYVIPIDGALPMMIVNAVLGWLLISNGIGYGLFKRWVRNHPMGSAALLSDLGIGIRGVPIWRTTLLCGSLFGFICGLQYGLELLWNVDFRYVFAFASDLTPYRALMFLLYLPLFTVGFVWMGYFVHGQLRQKERATLLRTFADWSLRNLVVMLVPLILLLGFQYIPLFATGFVPLVGPGSMFVLLVINVFHILGVMTLVVVLSTWMYLLTGKPYAGALLNGAVVTWMFASSQVIAPVPI